MTPLANGAAAILGLWLIANTCYVIALPGIFPVLRRVNPFRTFARWTMFGQPSSPAEIGAYVLEYRDHVVGQPAVWQIAGLSYRHHPAGFLLAPNRLAAEALRALAVWLEVSIERRATSAGAAALRRIERVLATHVEATCPLASGRAREIRIIRTRQRHRDERDVTLWQFAVTGRAGRG